MGTESDEKNVRISKRKTAENMNWSGNMLERTHFLPEKIKLSELVSLLSKAQREKLISGCDIKNFARIFEDAEIMSTVNCFLQNGMNVSKTARILYMHRNTLIYRLNKIQSVTGLDVRDFGCAVAFEILRAAYELK